MTLEELWKLFPIFLTEHKPYWSEWYKEEISLLGGMLPSNLKYYHIGSTAIIGIMAKPIIDIIIEVEAPIQLKEVADILQSNGYIVMSKSETRISLNKGYTENGFAEKVFHIHIRLSGDTDEVFFRDYLNSNTNVAKEYEKLKLQLSDKYQYNRDGYTDAKTDFVKKYTEIAKQGKS